MKFIALTIVALYGLSATFLNAQSVPFVIPGDDSSVSATDFSRLLDEPAGAKGFVHVKDGHFFTGDQRLRFWGMNLCFGANFPTHEEADKAAPHLAKLGCNAIRFHHMDMRDAPNGTWQTRRVSRSGGHCRSAPDTHAMGTHCPPSRQTTIVEGGKSY